MKNKHLNPIIRRVLYAVIIIVLHLLQFTVIPYTGLSFPVLLLLPMGIAIAMAEKEFSGALYGILIGALWDLSSPVTDGLWTLVFPVIFCLIGLLTHYTLRNTLLTALIFTLVATCIYLFIVCLYGIGDYSGEILTALMKNQLIPSLITSLILCIPEYYLVARLARATDSDRVSF